MEIEEVKDQFAYKRDLFRRTFSSPAPSASDAVESLLLLGEKPVLSSGLTQEHASMKRCATVGEHRESSTLDDLGYRNTSMMDNYYQKMRMRNNEASKRCRLKRRIKQESLDKTKILLERQKQVLSQRLVRLSKIKDLLADACREFNTKTDGSCNCVSYCKSIWATRDEMEEKNNISNYQLVRESKLLRNTNLEDILGAELFSDALKPMRRGPRKQDLDNLLLIDSQTGQIKSQSPLRVGTPGDFKYKTEGSSNGLEGPAKILEMVHCSSSSSLGGSDSSERSALDLFSMDSKMSSGDSQEALDLSRSQSQVFSQSSTGSEPSLHFEETSRSCPLLGTEPPPSQQSPLAVNRHQQSPPAVNRHQLPLLALKAPSYIQTRIVKKQAPEYKPIRPQGSSALIPNASTLITAPNTIILTPLSSSLPPTILKLPVPSTSPSTPVIVNSLSSLQASNPLSTMQTSLSSMHSTSLPPSPPSLSIVEKAEDEDIKPDPAEIKVEGIAMDQDQEDDDFPEQRNLCISMDEVDGPGAIAEDIRDRDEDSPRCAAHGNGSCSGELQDLNSLSHHLDLLTMQPKPPGSMTAAEKYIIKSRLGMVYWRADEQPAWICGQHRYDIIHSMDTMSCSLCGRKRSKKGPGPMYVINYRIGVEYHVTQGKFLNIGLLACQHCRLKTLKGIDFSDSVCVDDPLEKEDDRKISLPNSLSSSLANKSNLAAIQPVQQKQSIQEPNKLISNEGTIFSKIGKLNKSLQAVNPRYKPLGFSITSLESLSPSVLQDTLEATKIALQTILSTIAPGQEQQLWEAVKPFMEGAVLEAKPSHQ